MKYTYYAGGEIKVLGSAKQHAQFYFYRKYERSSVKRFGNKDVAYLRSSAYKGKLEKIVVQKVYMKNTTKTFFKNVNFYEDITNSIYREDELLTLQEAQELIGLHMLDFKEPVKKEIKKTIKEVKFSPKHKSGSVLYSLKSAKKGTLEKVFIVDSPKPKLYKDKFGSFWNESDLIAEKDAVSMVQGRQVVAPAPEVVKQDTPPIDDFVVGSIWADKIAAGRGELVKVLVAKVPNVYTIQDQFSFFWDKTKLISVGEAKAIALAYWKDRRNQLTDVINNTNDDVP